MGAVIGRREFVRNDEIDGQGKQVVIIAKSLKLTNVALDRLFHEFKKFENPKSNLMNIQAMFSSFKQDYCIFDRIIFQIFDKNKTGELNFLEYVIIMWGFLSTDEDGLAAFCFSLFDTERYCR
jgi:hypothetical protein